LLATVIASTSGCSFLFVDGPSPQRPPTEEPACTRVPILPVLDSLGALFFVGGGIIALAGGYDGGQSVEIGGSINIALIGIGVLQGWSAVSGFVKVTRCYDAYREYQAQAQAGTRIP
jgi:hypothetical protein